MAARLIVADIHSNLAALEAVVEDAGDVGEIRCMGDIVGYGPQPNECVDGLRKLGVLTVAGNHDLGASGRISLVDFSVYAREACRWTSDVLEDDVLAYLSSLPVELRLDDEALIVHGSPRDPVWEYVLYFEQVKEIFSATAERIIFVGHTHIPFVFRWLDGEIDSLPLGGGAGESVELKPEARYLINPGSVGQPRDRDPRASFMIVSDGMLEYRRIPYDIAVTQAKMADAGLPRFLIERLDVGE